MTTSQEKLFGEIPQLTSKKDWLVCKFQAKHALKVADQLDYVTGAADPEKHGYER